MEIWIVYALLGSIVTGIYGFLQKVQAENKINKNGFIIYSHLGMVIYGLLISLFSGNTIVFDPVIIGYAGLFSSIYVVILMFRLKSLKYLDSSTFFINYRIFSSILLIVIGQLLFGENISFNEYIGIILGFITFFLLVEKKYRSESITNFINGYIFLGIGVVGVSLIWLLQKNFILQNLDFTSYIFFSGISGIIMTLLLNWNQDSFKQIFIVKDPWNIFCLMISAIIFPFGMLLNLLAVDSGGDVAIVYKIISYSLFIPIILSIIFYKEKVTLKKLFAFILTVVSILLFV